MPPFCGAFGRLLLLRCVCMLPARCGSARSRIVYYLPRSTHCHRARRAFCSGGSQGCTPILGAKNSGRFHIGSLSLASEVSTGGCRELGDGRRLGGRLENVSSLFIGKTAGRPGQILKLCCCWRLLLLLWQS